MRKCWPTIFSRVLKNCSRDASFDSSDHHDRTVSFPGKCLHLSGLTPEPLTADDDYKLLRFGIGFTNMVARATKGSADLTRKEIKEGQYTRRYMYAKANDLTWARYNMYVERYHRCSYS